jgi:protein TonB
MDLEAGRASDVSPTAVAAPSVTPPSATAALPNTTPFAVAPAEEPPPGAPAAAAKRPEPPKPAPVLVAPRVKNRAEPAFPARARKAGPPGTIVLDVLVDEQGNPVRVVVKEGLGNADLESAAIHAVLRSSFEPAREGDTPVRGWTTERYQVKP